MLFRSPAFMAAAFWGVLLLNNLSDSLAKEPLSCSRRPPESFSESQQLEFAALIFLSSNMVVLTFMIVSGAGYR